MSLQTEALNHTFFATNQNLIKQTLTRILERDILKLHSL
jgi:hypothetical protein